MQLPLVLNHVSVVGDILARLDRNRSWDLYNRSDPQPQDPRWLEQVTTSMAHTKAQNTAREAAATKEAQESTPDFKPMSFWPDYLREAMESEELNPISAAESAGVSVFTGAVNEYIK